MDKGLYVEKSSLGVIRPPSQHRSEANKPLFEQASVLKASQSIFMLNITFKINIDREQKRLLDHDIIIFQFPHYIGTQHPRFLKVARPRYQNTPDLLTAPTVMNCRQKLVMQYHRWRQKEAYQTDGYNHFTIVVLLHRSNKRRLCAA
ncbi:hypothetical protein O9992_26630 [Vibrio lentus]|nr:hypothetical protein [Vibrio lentus]